MGREGSLSYMCSCVHTCVYVCVCVRVRVRVCRDEREQTICD